MEFFASAFFWGQSHLDLRSMVTWPTSVRKLLLGKPFLVDLLSLHTILCGLLGLHALSLRIFIFFGSGYIPSCYDVTLLFTTLDLLLEPIRHSTSQAVQDRRRIQKYIICDETI